LLTLHQETQKRKDYGNCNLTIKALYSVPDRNARNGVKSFVRKQRCGTYAACLDSILPNEQRMPLTVFGTRGFLMRL